MATGERVDQKQRTREDLLRAAARLMKQGRVPKLLEVAEEARVSRATAYRYLSSDEGVITEAARESSQVSKLRLPQDGECGCLVGFNELHQI